MANSVRDLIEEEGYVQGTTVKIKDLMNDVASAFVVTVGSGIIAIGSAMVKIGLTPIDVLAWFYTQVVSLVTTQTTGAIRIAFRSAWLQSPALVGLFMFATIAVVSWAIIGRIRGDNA